MRDAFTAAPDEARAKAVTDDMDMPSGDVTLRLDRIGQNLPEKQQVKLSWPLLGGIAAFWYAPQAAMADFPLRSVASRRAAHARQSRLTAVRSARVSVR